MMCARVGCRQTVLVLPLATMASWHQMSTTLWTPMGGSNYSLAMMQCSRLHTHCGVSVFQCRLSLLLHSSETVSCTHNDTSHCPTIQRATHSNKRNAAVSSRL